MTINIQYNIDRDNQTSNLSFSRRKQYPLDWTEQEIKFDILLDLYEEIEKEIDDVVKDMKNEL